MKEYQYNGLNVVLRKRKYSNGTLAVVMEDSSTNDVVAVLTKNLDPYTGERLQSEKKAFIDTNNVRGLIDWLHKNGIARYAGRIIPSGFCTYPLFEFNVRKLS